MCRNIAAVNGSTFADTQASRTALSNSARLNDPASRTRFTAANARLLTRTSLGVPAFVSGTARMPAEEVSRNRHGADPRRTINLRAGPAVAPCSAGGPCCGARRRQGWAARAGPRAGRAVLCRRRGRRATPRHPAQTWRRTPLRGAAPSDMGRALRAWWRRGAIASAALRRRATPTPGSGVPATAGDGRPVRGAPNPAARLPTRSRASRSQPEEIPQLGRAPSADPWVRSIIYEKGIDNATMM